MAGPAGPATGLCGTGTQYSRPMPDDTGAALARLRAHIDDVYARGTLPRESGPPHPVLPEGIEKADGHALRDLAVGDGVRRTLEVGFGPGLSTLFICEALLATGDPDTRHVAIDPLQSLLFGNAGLMSMKAGGVEGLVTFVPEPADVALPRMKEKGEQFDLAFVDGDHHFDNAFVDCFYCVQLVRPGGLLVIDDVWLPQLDLVARYLVTNLGCRRVGAIPAGSATARHRPGAGAQMAVLRTPEADTPVRPWDSYAPFTPPVPGWLARVTTRLARFDRDDS